MYNKTTEEYTDKGLFGEERYTFKFALHDRDEECLYFIEVDTPAF